MATTIFPDSTGSLAFIRKILYKIQPNQFHAVLREVQVPRTYDTGTNGTYYSSLYERDLFGRIWIEPVASATLDSDFVRKIPRARNPRAERARTKV